MQLKLVEKWHKLTFEKSSGFLSRKQHRLPSRRILSIWHTCDNHPVTNVTRAFIYRLYQSIWPGHGTRPRCPHLETSPHVSIPHAQCYVSRSLIGLRTFVLLFNAHFRCIAVSLTSYHSIRAAIMKETALSRSVSTRVQRWYYQCFAIQTPFTQPRFAGLPSACVRVTYEVICMTDRWSLDWIDVRLLSEWCNTRLIAMSNRWWYKRSRQRCCLLAVRDLEAVTLRPDCFTIATHTGKHRSFIASPCQLGGANQGCL